ncbi:MAG: 2-oxoacid:ferredoxin oxidoreductase subunit gamma [Dehalococcoidales bacterium]|nr:2-oxoacid:ferredoxin oxidoreductase subunit gamma [Dehalococcoidales bacterium]
MAGLGGQGIVLAGIILAEAAMLDGYFVAQSQTYGAETRGGIAVSDVILSNVEIDYPRASKLDILTTLTQEAGNLHLAALKPEGVAIVDAEAVHGLLWTRVASLHLQQIASEAGEARAINMAALGAIAAFCPLLSPDSLVKAITKRLPPARLAANLLAFHNALKLANKIRKNLEPVKTEESEV